MTKQFNINIRWGKATTAKRLILAIFIIVLLGSMIFIISYFTSKPTQNSPVITSSPSSSRINENLLSMWIMPSSQKTTLHTPTTFFISMDVKGKIINGADAILSYNSEYLKILSIEKADVPSLSNYSLHHTQKQNKVKLSLIKRNPDKETFSQITFAKIVVMPIKRGTTTLLLDFKKNDTSFSTIIDSETSKNILEKVTSAEIIID